MSLRIVVPMVALTLAMATGGCAQNSSSTQMRLAQMPAGSRCDELLRQVEIEMPMTVAARVAEARSDVQEAQELCNSGQSEEGISILRGVLASMHEAG
jgi:hypothetical protein